MDDHDQPRYPIIAPLPNSTANEIITKLLPEKPHHKTTVLTLKESLTEAEFRQLFGDQEQMVTHLGIETLDSSGKNVQMTIQHATSEGLSWQRRAATALASAEDPNRRVSGLYNRQKLKIHELTLEAGRALLDLSRLDPSRPYDVDTATIIRRAGEIGLKTTDLIKAPSTE